MSDILADAYQLTLFDGTSWSFRAVPQFMPWLKSMAGIMGLRSGNSDVTHALVFMPRRDGATLQLPEEFGGELLLPERGWRRFEVGIVFRAWYHAEQTVALIELNEDFLDHPEIQYIDMWSSLRLVHRQAVLRGGGPFHAAFGELDGRGVLISAAANTGKSTCYRRLPSPWKPLCDDQVLIACTQKGEIRAHPFPTWSDCLWGNATRAWDCHYSIPVAAILFLEQADKDAVSTIPVRTACAAMFRGAKQVWESHWSRVDDEERRRQSECVFQNAVAWTKFVPVYRLSATLHGRFWEEIEKIL